jgi:ATP phosphoribosyltransferase regulatory subunit HisZ
MVRLNLMLGRLFLLCVVLVAASCKKSGPPQALSIEKAPASLQEAFAKAKTEIKDLANQIIAAMQNKDYAKAHVDLQALCAASELTTRQREVATACMLTVVEQLQAAQAQGDQKAAEAIKSYRMNK